MSFVECPKSGSRQKKKFSAALLFPVVATGKSRPGICIATKAIAVSGQKRGDSSDGDASMRSDISSAAGERDKERERERGHGGRTNPMATTWPRESMGGPTVQAAFVSSEPDQA